VQPGDAEGFLGEVDAGDLAPRAAMDSARMPPPQPMSTTFLPAMRALSSIQSRRRG
jgi:hypothetical protein